MRLLLRSALFLLLAGSGLVTSACSTAGSYVWADDYVAAAAAKSRPDYVIARGDQLSVRVWNQDGMTTRARVRDDGRISLPLLGEVAAAGYEPNVLSQQLQTRLKDFFVNPVVTVAVEEPRAAQVAVAGEVSRPGTYALEPGATLLQVLTAAGGLTEFADQSAIFVLRPDGDQMRRIRFTWVALIHGEGRAGAFRVERGDSVVVE